MAVYRAICEGLQWGQQINNVLHIDLPQYSVNQAMPIVAENVKTHWITELRNIQSSSVLWTGVTVYAVEQNPMPAPYHTIFSIGGLETSTPTQTVPFTCFVLRIRTGFAGRTGRGRIYSPGVHNGWSLNGGIHSVALSNWATRIANLVPKWKGGGTLETTLGVCPRGGGFIDFKPMISLELAPQLGVQRRRNVGIGV
jgi:hypothetical protein